MIDKLFLKLHNKVYKMFLESEGSLCLSPFFGYELRIFLNEEMDEQRILQNVEAFFIHYKENNEDYFLINTRNKNESIFIHELQHAYFEGLNGNKYKDLTRLYHYLMGEISNPEYFLVGYFLYYFNDNEFSSLLHEIYISHFRREEIIYNITKLSCEKSLIIINNFINNSLDNYLKKIKINDTNIIKNQIYEIMVSYKEKLKLLENFKFL